MWPQSEQWLKACNVKIETYYGGIYNGNDSIWLLRNVDDLEALSPPIQFAVNALLI